MKKTLLIAAMAFSSLLASAQTERGKALFGITLNLEQSKGKGDNAESLTSFSVAPMGGIFISDNFCLGAAVGYVSEESSDPYLNGYNLDYYRQKSSAVIAAPFARYYKNIAGQFKFFGQASVPMVFADVDNASGSNGMKSQSIGFTLSPGFVFFPAKKFGLELSFTGISYLDTIYKDGDGNKIKGSGSSTFSLGFDTFSPQIGFNFYL